MNLSGDRGPAKQGWCCASKATNDNILRRRTLQKHGVNEGVADQARHRQNGSQHINRDSE